MDFCTVRRAQDTYRNRDAILKKKPAPVVPMYLVRHLNGERRPDFLSEGQVLGEDLPHVEQIVV